MSEVANIFDSGPISLIARVKDKIGVWGSPAAKYIPLRVEYVDNFPASDPFVVDMCFQGGVFNPLPANGQLTKSAPLILQINALELYHFRWEPIDPWCEGQLFEDGAMPKYNGYGGQGRTSIFTRLYDQWLSTTTFFVLGKDNNVNINAVNTTGGAQNSARFQFFGFRYLLSDKNPETGQPWTCDGPITYLPAQGR